MESEPSLWKESIEWIPSLGVAYELGMDGMGCIMLALTALIMPVSIAASQRAGYKHEGFGGCLLMTQGTLVGVFTAQNFFAWFFFCEIARSSLFSSALVGRPWQGEGLLAILYLFHSGQHCLTGRLPRARLCRWFL